MREIKNAVLRMARINLGIGKNERILVFVDDFDKKTIALGKEISEILSEEYSTSFLVYNNTGQNGKEPNNNTARALLNYDVIIMLNTFSLTHTLARKNATDRGARIASMPGFKRKMFFSSMNADYNKIRERTLKLKKLARNEKLININSTNGTNLVIEYNDGIQDDFGIYKNKGEYGNLPAGEIFLAPKSVNGRFVINSGWFFESNFEKPNSDPIIFSIVNSRIKEIECKSIGERLRNLFFKFPHRRKVAELGIGLNEEANDRFSILEAEKILGTIHIAFGNNIYFGGKNKSDVHYDFVLNNPTLFIGKNEIITNGKYLV